MGKRLTDKVSWVGIVDWELETFHGREYSVDRGSTYNSYLVRAGKTALIDTVWTPFAKEFVDGLKREVDLGQIDYVVAQHSEADHSGALPLLMREIPDVPVYCTKNGMRFLKAQYHEDWNFVTVKTGDVLSLGEADLVFVEAPMLHWPDSMFTYMTGDEILFSNDAFGQHYATQSIYSDKVDRAELMAEAMKYYANILTPFSPLVTRKIDEVLSLGLPVQMICTSHGVIWKDDPMEIVEKYKQWADSYKENQITLVYDTMWDSTRHMAVAIAEGILSVDPAVTVKLLNGSIDDKNDIMTEVFRSKGILVGSSTVYNGLLHSIGGLLGMMKGLKFRGKAAAAFGSHGWSGEGVGLISAALKDAGFNVVDDGLKMLWNPDEEGLAECFRWGKEIARLMV